ncbi:hypothetical protein HOG98_08475 [bacterium]|jgi:hypothetical protein|nr:hypothetical protein [bacterium]
MTKINKIISYSEETLTTINTPALPVFSQDSLKQIVVGEGGGFLVDLGEEDVRLFNELLENSLNKINKFLGDNTKPLIVYIGIGTGNPSSGFVNPSANSGYINQMNCRLQSSPSFLSNETTVSEFKIVTINFNSNDEGETEAFNSRISDIGDRLDIKCVCKFPLTSTDTKLAEIFGGLLKKNVIDVSQQNVIMITMNAITDTHYPGINSFVDAISPNKSEAKNRTKLTVYMNSYLQENDKVDTYITVPRRSKMGFLNASINLNEPLFIDVLRTRMV